MVTGYLELLDPDRVLPLWDPEIRIRHRVRIRIRLGLVKVGLLEPARIRIPQM
jgi:hypothetical protein